MIFGFWKQIASPSAFALPVVQTFRLHALACAMLAPDTQEDVAKSVLKALQQREESFQSLELKFTRKIYQTLESNRPTEALSSETSVSRNQTIEDQLKDQLRRQIEAASRLKPLQEPRLIATVNYHQFFEGEKYRHDAEWTGRDPIGSSGKSSGNRLRAFDGEYVRTLEDHPHGRLGAIDTAQRGRGPDPEFKFTRLLTITQARLSIVGFLESCAVHGTLRSGTVAGPSGSNRLFLEAIFPNKGWLGTRLVVDAERDFAPVEIAQYSGEMLETRFSISELALTAVGVWFPKGAKCEYFDSSSEVQGQSALRLVGLETISVDLESVRIGQDIPDEVFRLEFPDGSRIQDEVSQTSYIVGSPQVTTLPEGADAFFRIDEAVSHVSLRRSLWKTLVGILAVPTLLLTLLLILQQRRRRAKQYDRSSSFPQP
jgi:hypothetical protein